MNDEQTPDVEEIKDRLKIEIPVEEEESASKESGDLAGELKGLGRQFAEALNSAWNSEERARFEADLRQGVTSFVDEMDKVIHEAKQSPAAERVKREAEGVRQNVDSGEMADRLRTGLGQGLAWMSQELGRLADQFMPAEKSPADVAGDVDDMPAEKTPEEETPSA